MSLDFPSNAVRRLFNQFVRNTIATEGEPAALGKSSSGPVYFTDNAANEHKNRVWFRKGANKEVLGVARADNMGIPDVPDLPIQVAERFGIHWVLNYDRNDPNITTGSSGVHQFPAWTFGPSDADNVTNPTFTWYWKYSGSVDGSAVTTYFIADGASTEVTVDFYWYDLAASTANVVWQLAFYAESDGEGWADSYESQNYTVTSAGQFSINKETFTFSLSSAQIAAGDIVGVEVRRLGGNASDTSTGDAGFALAIINE